MATFDWWIVLVSNKMRVSLLDNELRGRGLC